MTPNVTVQEGDVWDVASASVPVVHCVSADFALGAGFAKEVSDRYPSIRRTLQYEAADWPPDNRIGCSFVYAAPDGQIVHNLVTKTKYYMRADRDAQPNLATLASALRDAHQQALERGSTHVVMPRIGAGLDRLSWPRTLDLVERIFSDEGSVKVTVCVK